MSGSAATSISGSTCCENGRPLVTDPHTGQTVCSCQYSSPPILSYPRLPETMYGTTPYATQSYVPIGTDTSAFYSPLVSYLYQYFLHTFYSHLLAKEKISLKDRTEESL